MSGATDRALREVIDAQGGLLAALSEAYAAIRDTVSDQEARLAALGDVVDAQGELLRALVGMDAAIIERVDPLDARVEALEAARVPSLRP